MRINLSYNKIVADTVTESFVESFNAIAVPKLLNKFSDVEEVIIYEDCLSDGLVTGGTFYCPLTLVRSGNFSRAFASWRFDSKRFKDEVPYSYVGKEPLNIEISDSAPSEIEKKLDTRVPFFAKNAIKLTVTADAPTKTFLSGKYSQSFVDIMRDKLTRAIEKEFSITGLEDSSLEISLVFAPGSFMEHVLDNTSYRRVLVSAKSCAPRDLWIKWTRLDGNGTYTVSSYVKESDVRFEICDDVPEKIREREYRYLIGSNGQSAYKNAMSRKNFMEWRELVKRVIKRGEVSELKAFEDENLIVQADPYNPQDSVLQLPKDAIEKDEGEKFTEPPEDDAFDSEISIKLQSVLENYNIETEDSEEPEEEDINPDITELLRTLLAGGEENSADEDGAPDGDDELPPFDIDELSISQETEDEKIEEEIEDVEETPEEAPVADSFELVEEAEDEPEAQEELPSAPSYSFESELQRYSKENEILSEKDNEISELKEKNQELNARLLKLEAENIKLSELLESYELKAVAARKERAALIEKLDAAKRREEREKDRLAEAAKIAVAERYESDKPVYEDKEPLPEKASEKEEIPALEKENEPLVATEPEKLEPEKEEQSEKPSPVRYVSKVADITFRHPVDPNITKRIQEIIVTTVKYFGKEDVYMKIKLTIPDHYMVRLEFVKIPENESALLSDIIRVLGHSKLGITKVLLD